MQVLIRTDRLLVKQMESESVTKGGIILPDQSKVKQAWATVLQIGPDVEDIEEGDRIAFADFSGVNVELETDEGKQEFLILSQDDVLLVLRDEKQGLNTQELDNHDDTNQSRESYQQINPLPTTEIEGKLE